MSYPATPPRQILPRATGRGIEISASSRLTSNPITRKSASLHVAMRVLRHGYNEPMSGSDHVKPASPGLKLTYDDFVLFPDDGKRHELIDGEHYVTPSPNTRHQEISISLVLLIGGWLETHPVGRVFHAPFDVVFSNFDVVEPDLLYLSNQRAADVITPLHVRGYAGTGCGNRVTRNAEA